MARTEGKRQAPRNRPENVPPSAAPPARPDRPQRPRRSPSDDRAAKVRKGVIIGAAGLVVLAAVVFLSAQLATEDATATTTVAADEVTVRGDRLPGFAPGEDAALGMTAPEVESVDFSGAPSNILHDGTPKLIIFLAHWCPHCQREVTAMQNWINQNGLPEGAEFVSVATSIDRARPNYPPDEWLQREGWTPRVVVDDSSSDIGVAYGLSAFPYYVMIDGAGTVLQRFGGEQDPAVVGGLLTSLASG